MSATDQISALNARYQVPVTNIWPVASAIAGSVTLSTHSSQLAVIMKAELQEVMNMLRKLQGAIDFGNAPVAEREELAGDVTEIMDALFEVVKRLPDE